MGGKGCRYFVGRWNGGLLGAEIATCNCCHSSQIRKSECSFLFILIFLYKMCTGKAVLHSPYKILKKNHQCCFLLFPFPPTYITAAFRFPDRRTRRRSDGRPFYADVCFGMYGGRQKSQKRDDWWMWLPEKLHSESPSVCACNQVYFLLGYVSTSRYYIWSSRTRRWVRIKGD